MRTLDVEEANLGQGGMAVCEGDWTGWSRLRQKLESTWFLGTKSRAQSLSRVIRSDGNVFFFFSERAKSRRGRCSLCWLAVPRTAGVWTEFCGEEHLTSVIILKSNSMHRELDKIQKMRSEVSQM